MIYHHKAFLVFPGVGENRMVQPEPTADGAPADVPLFTIENKHRQHELPDQPDGQQFYAHQSGFGRREIGAQGRVSYPAQQPHGRAGSQPNSKDLPECVLIFF